LLGAVLRLRQGLVVLPGLDDDEGAAGQARWDGIRLADAQAGQRGDPGHPQWALKTLLAGLGLTRADVQRWAHDGGTLDGPPGRAAALVAALAPAVAAQAQPVPEAQVFDHVALAECATAAEEAQVVALALREAVEQPGVRAALITPDPDLARRVAAHCQRWGIAIDSSAGTPLGLMPPGALAQDLVAAMAEAFAPTRLLAVLKHSLIRRGDRDFAAAVLTADLALRGVRPPPGLEAAGEAILNFVDETRGDHDAMAAWWEDVAAALAPLEALREAGQADLAGLMAGLRQAITALAGDDGWSGPDGRQLAALVAAVEEHGALFGAFRPDEAPALLSALMRGSTVRVPGQGHPRLSILGPVEAQLTRADVVILAGLNEGTWPGQPAPDPWLAPVIRARLGLPGTARAQGLAAQDFLRAAAAPRVLITRARRDASGPRLPSRLWLRLLAHGGPHLHRRDDLVALARALDGAAAPRPQPPPRPNPPLRLRPRKLSITEIDTLIADPFAFHAKHILKLRALDPLDQDPTAAMRGTLVHIVLERWIDAGHGTLDQLDRIIAAELEREAAHFPLLAVAWVPRMRVALHWAGVEILKREQFGTSFVAEAKGRLELPGGILLTGKIDRVDRTEAGEIMVIDYKTGSPPTKARVRALDANQLALGLAMAVAGVLIKQGQALPGGAAATIEYWQLQGARKAAGTIHAPLEGRDPIDAAAHVAAAVARAGELAAHYLLSENPFEPKLRPEWAWGDYDHLARVPEWISRPRSAA
jgi:ATP-dependent helicase/nuclease subunit B